MLTGLIAGQTGNEMEGDTHAIQGHDSKGSFLRRKVQPQKVEEALNAYAGEGWVLKGVATATFPTLTGGREELVIFLERED